MRLLSFANFEMPTIFSRVFDRDGAGQPPKSSPGDTRHADDFVKHPRVEFHDPNSLHFPEAMRPVVPGNANVTAGISMVEYCHQPTWDRGALDLAGPVRTFFASQMYDNRVKHL
jgi:hypothetical protein